MKPLILLPIVLLALARSPSSFAQSSPAEEWLPPLPAGQAWHLLWHDEFDGNTLDETKWNRLGDAKRRDGWWIKEDAYLSGHGTLLLRTRKDGDRYTCGAVNTQGKFEHAFGYYVARCKIPAQPGHWPAFWMMCGGVATVGNDGRDGTEIDIMEMPWRDGKVTFNLHWDGYGEHHKSAGTKTNLSALTKGFHNYSLFWTPEEYVFHVDGQEVWRTRAGGVSQVPEYLKLTEEIGKWGGDITRAELPDYFEVEYVRVYAMRPEGARAGSGHRFVCTDYTQGKVFVVAADGRVEWEYAAPSCNDLWVLPNGNLLFNTGHGVQEVTRAKQVVFNYQSRSEIYACQRLPDGNTFIGECNAGRLLEVAPDGRIAKEIRLLPEGKDGGHAYMRNARRLANGHYLVAHYGDQAVREYDAQGRVLREIPAEGGPHSVARLANGNTLVSCGDMRGGSRVFEVDPEGRILWQVQGDELPGISLKFVAGFERLPSGNTVLCNWLGHGQFGKAPHVIEVTPDKQVVWTFADHQRMRTVSNIQLLEASRDEGRGEIAH